MAKKAQSTPITRYPLAVTKVAGVRTPKPTGTHYVPKSQHVRQPKAPGLPETGK